MNNGGEAAEMIVRLYLEGFEEVVKLTGTGIKNLVVTRYDAETGIQNQRQRATVKYDKIRQPLEGLYLQE